MPVTAFEGPAGTGKTHNLIDHLGDRIGEQPLASHERVLALTFMHGARRRLDSRLREIRAVGRQYQAVTVDSFAWRLVQRWRRLAASLGYATPPEDRYDDTCALAATLLARPAVKSWVALSYPVMLVDEAQDLSTERSAMIAEVTTSAHVILAYDEFQCLNPALRPMPIGTWLPGACRPVSLTECHRTKDAELLAAARALRDGQALHQNGRSLKVTSTPGQPHFAATYLANFIKWRDGGRVAVLTPSRSGGFAGKVVDLVCSRSVGKHQNGPYPIEWESSDENEQRDLWQRLAFPDRCSIANALAVLKAHAGVPAIKSAMEWIARQKRVLGIDEVTAGEVRRQIDRTFAARRRYGVAKESEFVAMTIQQAKNRQFEHVVVIWPYTVRDDPEQKRRLLYNAITRAQRSCLVLVQAQSLLESPPFVA